MKKRRPARGGGSSKVQSLLETYFKEINEVKLLDKEEEHRLACRVEQGDPEARDLMIRANLRLVVNIARSYTGRGVELADLIAEGNLGLMRAVEGFDSNRNIRFSTYASYWVKQSVKRGIANTAKTVRLPAYMVDMLAKWYAYRNRLFDDLGREPSFEEVAAEMELNDKAQRKLKKALTLQPLGIQESPDSDGEGNPFGEFFADENGMKPDERLSEEDDLDLLLELRGLLSPREDQVLRMRFGLDGEEPQTLKEIGAKLGLTRERVRQIEFEALQKLREEVETSR